MPIFYLEPRDGDISNRSWEASTIAEGCWVDAPFEDVARLFVESATIKMTDVRLGEPVVYSPWQQEALTTCVKAEAPREIPEGRVLTRGGQLLDIPGFAPR